LGNSFEQHSFASFRAVSYQKDKTNTYLYFKNQTQTLFSFKTKNKENISRTTLLTALNQCIESSSNALNICGQTARNHLKTQKTQKILQTNTKRLK
jgi:hypothetical protein